MIYSEIVSAAVAFSAYILKNLLLNNCIFIGNSRIIG
jgi:hypothetical protein